MDLERSPPASPAEAAGGGAAGAACSICLDSVLALGGGRSVAKLQCGHEFHLGQIPSPPCCAAVFAQPDLTKMVALVGILQIRPYFGLKWLKREILAGRFPEFHRVSRCGSDFRLEL